MVVSREPPVLGKRIVLGKNGMVDVPVGTFSGSELWPWPVISTFAAEVKASACPLGWASRRRGDVWDAVQPAIRAMRREEIGRV